MKLTGPTTEQFENMKEWTRTLCEDKSQVKFELPAFHRNQYIKLIEGGMNTRFEIIYITKE